MMDIITGSHVGLKIKGEKKGKEGEINRPFSMELQPPIETEPVAACGGGERDVPAAAANPDWGGRNTERGGDHVAPIKQQWVLTARAPQPSPNACTVNAGPVPRVPPRCGHAGRRHPILRQLPVTPSILSACCPVATKLYR